jgi:hypothetical protein
MKAESDGDKEINYSYPEEKLKRKEESEKRRKEVI